MTTDMFTAWAGMSWKHRTPEKWMRIGFTVLVIVGVICTLLIIVAKLR